MRSPPPAHAFLPPILLALASFAALAAMTLSPPDTGPVAAIFSPALSRDEVFARVAIADAALVRHGAFDGIVVAASDAPGLAARLRSAGAWLVLDPEAIGGCLDRPTTTSTSRG